MVNSMTSMAKYDVCMALEREGEQSQSALENLTVEHPDFALAWNALGAVKKRTGDIIEAIRCAEKYAELVPEDAFAFSILSSYYLVVGNRDKAEEALGNAHDIRLKAQFGTK